MDLGLNMLVFFKLHAPNSNSGFDNHILIYLQDLWRWPELMLREPHVFSIVRHQC